MTVDVKRAYFHARSRRLVYIEIPIEDFEPGDEHMVGRLNLILYGTRDAAPNWTREYTEFLQSIWFQVRSGVTLQLLSQTKRALLHSARRRLHNHWPNGGLELENKFEITATVLGRDEGMENEIRVLNHTLRWTDSGITYEPDQRHAEIIIKEFNLFESSKNTTEPPKSVQRRANPVGTPAVPDNQVALQESDNSEYIDKHDASRHRALSARLNYLSLDRLDLQFSLHGDTSSVGLGSLEEDRSLLGGVFALSSNFPMASSGRQW